MKGKVASKQKKPAKTQPPKESAERCVTPHAITYDTINEAVHEYLLKSGLFKTVDAFQVMIKTWRELVCFSKSCSMESSLSTLTSRTSSLARTSASPSF